ncbi:MAG: GGDEF domain-containing protein [Chloroflexota bacterium]
MDLTQDVLLPLLLAAIVINTVIIAAVLAVGRMNRSKRMAPAGPAASEVERTLSTSYVDRSARATWPAEPIDAGVSDVAPDDGPDVLLTTADETATEADDSQAEAVEVEVEIEDGRDALTGLIGPSAFMRLVVDEDGRMQRYHRPATVVIIELDGLERLLERLGPSAGERVIPAVADTVSRLARGADHVARLGPGRFGVLLPETDEVAAINYIERVRRACELWLESGAIAMRLAIGWAGSTGDPSLPDAQRIAMDRMFVELRRHARVTDAVGGAAPLGDVSPGRGGSRAQA